MLEQHVFDQNENELAMSVVSLGQWSLLRLSKRRTADAIIRFYLTRNQLPLIQNNKH